MLRDWVKAQVTIIECGILSFDAVLLPYMLEATVDRSSNISLSAIFCRKRRSKRSWRFRGTAHNQIPNRDDAAAVAGAVEKIIGNSMNKQSKNKPLLKPATPPPPEVKPSDSPTLVAQWSDGTKTRMSTYTLLKKLDLKRGIALARAAYSSRKKMPMAAIEATIVEVHFEKDGLVVRTYTPEELKEAMS